MNSFKSFISCYGISFLEILATGIYFYLSVRTFFINKTSMLHRFASLLFLFFGFWSFGQSFTHHPNLPKSALQFFNNVSSFGWIFFSSFLLSLATAFSKNKYFKRYPVLYLFYFIMPFYFFIMQISKGVLFNSNFKLNYGYRFFFNHNIFTLLYFINTLINIVLSLIILFKIPQLKGTAIARRQSVLSFILGLIVLSACFYVDILSPVILNNYSIPNIAILFILIWALGLYFYLRKYNLLPASTKTAAENILSTMNEAVIITDSRLFINFLNDAALKLIGEPRITLLNKHISIIFKDWFKLNSFINGSQNLTEIMGIVYNNKKNIPVRFSMTEIKDDINNLNGVIFLIRDVSKQKKYEDKLIFLANYDSLTALLNRKSFEREIKDLFQLYKRSDSLGALLYIDLDNFKYINDNFGHKYGDIVLKQIAMRLRRSLRKTDRIFRLGGDEFTVIIRNIKDISIVRGAAVKILKIFNEDFLVFGNRFHLSASIGISLFNKNSKNIENIISEADEAMYEAKRNGGNSIQFSYSIQFNDRAV